MAEEMPEIQRASTRTGAISLTYDGGDPSHLEIVVRALAERELKATFFLPSLPMLENPKAWAAAQSQGFEIGSHSLDGFTDEQGNLPNWTLDMVEEDLRMSRKLLTELFLQQTDFAFAYPGTECGCVHSPYNQAPSTYDSVVKKLFRVAKTAIPGTNVQSGLDITALKSFDAFGVSSRELESISERAIEERSWAILSFRGVGAGDLAIDVREHNQFLDWIAAHDMSIRVAPILAHATQLLVPSGFLFES
jgi:peptidoglycan/xylan/chitin deacetylase (PgdA/CDA1 family)